MSRRTEAGDRLDREIEAAIRRGEELSSKQPRATRAFYDAEDRRIVVELQNGCVFGFPPELGEGLVGATDEQLAEVEVEGDGYGLHWESLDADLTVPGVLNGIFGSRVWMAELGRRGGSATSEAKKRASRTNGSKGGRPRKRAG